MNVLSASTPVNNIGIVSQTPAQAPSSFKLSPPPLKQHRLPRHIAVRLNESVDCDGEFTDSSSLISIMHGHELTTPRDFSYASNFASFSAAPLDESKQDSIANHAVADDEMDDEIADFEVAMYATNTLGQQALPSNCRTSSAVEFRGDSEITRPLFPQDDEFTAPSNDRERFALLPRIKLFQEKY